MSTPMSLLKGDVARLTSLVKELENRLLQQAFIIADLLETVEYAHNTKRTGGLKARAEAYRTIEKRFYIERLAMCKRIKQGRSYIQRDALMLLETMIMLKYAPLEVKKTQHSSTLRVRYATEILKRYEDL